MNRRKKKNTGLILILLILGISIGFAILTTNLKINGIGRINKATWNIHWDNVILKDSTAQASSDAVITDQKKTQVEYSVVFNKPGDFYEFTVDAVNEGTIDGEVDAVSNILLDGTDQEIEYPPYIKSEVTYVDGKEIEQHHLLKSGKRERYKVKVTYSSSVDKTTLVTTDTTYKFKFSVTYVQSSSSATDRGTKCNANLYELYSDIDETKYNEFCEDYMDDSIYAYEDNNDGITITGFKDGYTVEQVKSAVRDLTASKLNNDRELLIRQVDNNTISFKDGIWAIPSKIDNKTVTKIAGAAFYNKGISAQLVLPPTVDEIEDSALDQESDNTVGSFQENSITGVALPNSIEKIGSLSF